MFIHSGPYHPIKIGVNCLVHFSGNQNESSHIIIYVFLMTMVLMKIFHILGHIEVGSSSEADHLGCMLL